MDEARRRLGRVGAGLTVPIAPGEEWRRTARRVEDAGYGAVRVNEVIGGREVLAQMAVLLGATAGRAGYGAPVRPSQRYPGVPADDSDRRTSDRGPMEPGGLRPRMELTADSTEFGTVPR